MAKLYDKSDIPKQYHDVFDQLTGEGKSPAVIRATIEYIETEKSQFKAACEYDVTTISIRNNCDRICDAVGVDVTGAGGEPKREIQRTVIDAAGLKEGDDYSDSGHDFTVKKSGWKRIRDALTTESADS